MDDINLGEEWSQQMVLGDGWPLAAEVALRTSHHTNTCLHTRTHSYVTHNSQKMDATQGSSTNNRRSVMYTQETYQALTPEDILTRATAACTHLGLILPSETGPSREDKYPPTPRVCHIHKDQNRRQEARCDWGGLGERAWTVTV